MRYLKLWRLGVLYLEKYGIQCTVNLNIISLGQLEFWTTLHKNLLLNSIYFYYIN